MGVYIKRYTHMDEMPEDCTQCCYYNKIENMPESCSQEKRDVSKYVLKKYRPSWCPLSKDKNQLDGYGSWM